MATAKSNSDSLLLSTNSMGGPIYTLSLNDLPTT